MSSETILTLAILAVALVLFLSERVSVDLVALLVLVALGLSSILSSEEVFSGLSDPAVITIMAIFVLAHGLEVTGVAERMGVFLARSGGGELWITLKLMGLAAFMSLFMNNIAVASILMPAMFSLAKKTNISLSRLLMPLAFGTLLGGMATLFTTTNIVVNSVLQDAGYTPFGVLDFVRMGLPLTIAGIAYMVLLGRHLLPKQPSEERATVLRQADDLLDTYHLDERLFRARIPAGSILTGKALARSTLREAYNLNVVAVERGDERYLDPSPEFLLEQGDVMLLSGRLEEFRKIDVEPYLEILPMKEYDERDLESASTVVLELVLSPRSQHVGHTLKEAHFRENLGMTILAVWNGQSVVRTGLADHRLEFGDALLVQGPRDRLPMLRSNPDLIVLSSEEEPVRHVNGRSRRAVGIFLVTVLITMLGILPTGAVMLAGALALVLSNVVTMEQVYRAIDWKVIFLIAGMLPLGMALNKTGASDLIASQILQTAQPYGHLGILLAMMVLTVVLSQAMKGAAVSAVVTPIALTAAQAAGMDPHSLALGVAMATSIAFVTPLGHPVNILVLGPSGYRFKDFFRVGLPLTLLLMLLITLWLPRLWPLG